VKARDFPAKADQQVRAGPFDFNAIFARSRFDALAILKLLRFQLMVKSREAQCEDRGRSDLSNLRFNFQLR
jgi:hypothetical protein